MSFAVKLPLDLEGESALVLEGQSRILNWASNHLLEVANTKKEEFKTTQNPELANLIYSKTGLRNLLPRLKQEKPFLQAVHSVPLKNAAIRLSKSIQSFQQDRKKKKSEQRGVGWPKFTSSKKRFFSLLYDEYGNGFQLRHTNDGWFLDLSLGNTQEGQRLKLEIQIREMPRWLSQAILEANKNYPQMRKSLPSEERKKFHIRKLMPFTELRVKREGKYWYAILTAKKPLRTQVTALQGAAVIDPNHKNLGYLIDSQGKGIEIANLPFVKPLDQRIDQIKRRRDLCNKKSTQVTRKDGSVFYKPSRKWKFFSDYLDELYRVRREQTKVGLYTISNSLFQHYDLVAIGNYTPRGGGISTGMRRAMNNQSQIGKLKQALKWVSQREGKLYYEWDEKNSTKKCHACNTSTEETRDPSVRTWKCRFCNVLHLRDENAAKNGSRLTIEWIKQNQLPCSGHLDAIVKSKKIFPVSSRWAWSFDGRGISVSRAKECFQ